MAKSAVKKTDKPADDDKRWFVIVSARGDSGENLDIEPIPHTTPEDPCHGVALAIAGCEGVANDEEQVKILRLWALMAKPGHLLRVDRHLVICVTDSSAMQTYTAEPSKKVVFDGKIDQDKLNFEPSKRTTKPADPKPERREEAKREEPPRNRRDDDPPPRRRDESNDGPRPYRDGTDDRRRDARDNRHAVCVDDNDPPPRRRRPVDD